MPKLDDQISTLQEKLQQLKLRQQRLDARKRASEALRPEPAPTMRAEFMLYDLGGARSAGSTVAWGGLRLKTTPPAGLRGLTRMLPPSKRQ